MALRKSLTPRLMPHLLKDYICNKTPPSADRRERLAVNSSSGRPGRSRRRHPVYVVINSPIHEGKVSPPIDEVVRFRGSAGRWLVPFLLRPHSFGCGARRAPDRHGSVGRTNRASAVPSAAGRGERGWPNPAPGHKRSRAPSPNLRGRCNLRTDPKCCSSARRLQLSKGQGDEHGRCGPCIS
jgi:hypothetical protein